MEAKKHGFPEKVKVGRIIAERRKEIGMTQEKLAEELGYSEPSTISAWESGRSLPEDPAKRQRLYEILGIDITEMISEMEQERKGTSLFIGMPPGIIDDADYSAMAGIEDGGTLFPTQEEFLYIYGKIVYEKAAAEFAFPTLSMMQRLQAITRCDKRLKEAERYGHGEEFWYKNRFHMADQDIIPIKPTELKPPFFIGYMDAYMTAKAGRDGQEGYTLSEIYKILSEAKKGAGTESWYPVLRFMDDGSKSITDGEGEMSDFLCLNRAGAILGRKTFCAGKDSYNRVMMERLLEYKITIAEKEGQEEAEENDSEEGTDTDSFGEDSIKENRKGLLRQAFNEWADRIRRAGKRIKQEEAKDEESGTEMEIAIRLTPDAEEFLVWSEPGRMWLW